MTLYPGANILAAGKDDFESQNRKKLFSRIATGNWDAVIVIAGLALTSAGYCSEDDDRKAADEMSAAFRAYHKEMFDKFPVEFVLDDDSTGPIMNPSEFALGAEVRRADPRDGLSMPDKFKKLDSRQTINEFADWCNNVWTDDSQPDGRMRGPKLQETVDWMKGFGIGPDKEKLAEWREPQNAIRMNREAMEKGKGLFGAVGLYAWDPKKEETWRYVTYMMFFAYNKAKGPLDYGDHEGDWICVDLLVYGGKGDKESKLVGAFFHHHGDRTFVPASALNYDTNGAIMAFVEKGSNEPFWEPGPAQTIHIDIQLGPNQVVGDYEIIRSHMGGGMKYCSKGKVVDISGNVLTLDGRLMHFYPGEWGAEHKCPGITKQLFGPVTSPPSPPWQEKMWTNRNP